MPPERLIAALSTRVAAQSLLIQELLATLDREHADRVIHGVECALAERGAAADAGLPVARQQALDDELKGLVQAYRRLI